MNYTQTLDYLYAQLPMFQRIGATAYKANLHNTISICELLGNPQQKIKTIHVAGTNGKGSVSHMLASILQCAGYKTGLYTSPHLKDFRERIKINGAYIPEEYIVEFVANYKNAFEKIKPSFFEMTVGLAFNYFASEKVDIAVIETGMGGRLDSTNIIQPILSVITNISKDHVAFLGNSMTEIAFEKAGIIKHKTPVVIGEANEQTRPVFIEKAKQENAPILFAQEQFKVENAIHIHDDRLLLSMDIVQNSHTVYKDLKTELPGFYQTKNIVTLLTAVDQLNKQGYLLDTVIILKGIKEVVQITGLLGRWQILSSKPLIIADTGHNEAGITEITKQLYKTPHKNLHFVLGVVNDKDIAGILGLLPKNATYYFCQAAIPRALDIHTLKNMASKYALHGETYMSVPSALEAAKKTAEPNDLIFIGGSTFTVAEIL